MVPEQTAVDPVALCPQAELTKCQDQLVASRQAAPVGGSSGARAAGDGQSGANNSGESDRGTAAALAAAQAALQVPLAHPVSPQWSLSLLSSHLPVRVRLCPQQPAVSQGRHCAR